MGNFVVDRAEDTLVVRRNRLMALNNLLLTFCMYSLLAAIPLVTILVYHYLVWANAIMASLAYLLGLPMMCNTATYLSKKVFVFDRARNQVSLNGRQVCALSEVSSVVLDHDRIKNGRIPINRRQLYLKTAEGKDVQIEFGSASGASYEELKQVGISIAQFACVKSNIS